MTIPVNPNIQRVDIGNQLHKRLAEYVLEHVQYLGILVFVPRRDQHRKMLKLGESLRTRLQAISNTLDEPHSSLYTVVVPIHINDRTREAECDTSIKLEVAELVDDQLECLKVGKSRCPRYRREHTVRVEIPGRQVSVREERQQWKECMCAGFEFPCARA
ncbi:hypothetical protein BC629DRAFT_544760 [Irpex lacteus]|nr:hypothetical protein BC629DRAFT_544760 [Irpex lacteus]